MLDEGWPTVTAVVIERPLAASSWASDLTNCSAASVIEFNNGPESIRPPSKPISTTLNTQAAVPAGQIRAATCRSASFEKGDESTAISIFIRTPMLLVPDFSCPESRQISYA